MRYHRLSTISFTILSLCYINANALATPKAVTQTCPALNQLEKNPITLLWSTKSGWVSHAGSFAKQPTQFIGAQWKGVKEGTIFCLYKDTKDRFTFPIKLEHPGLVKEPLGKKWIKMKGGYKNCYSNKRSNCAFIPVTSQQVSINQVLNSLDS